MCLEILGNQNATWNSKGNNYSFWTGKPTSKLSSAWTRPTPWERMRRVWASSTGTSSANHPITIFPSLMAPSPGLARNMAWTMKRFQKSQFTGHYIPLLPGVVERGSVEKHSMVLWSCFVCGQRYQIDAEFWQDKVQEDLHRQASQLYHSGEISVQSSCACVMIKTEFKSTDGN